MGEIKKRLPLQCPACDAPLRVGRLFCEECRTEVCGDFELPVLARLSDKEQQFILAFVKSSGSLKDMAKSMGHHRVKGYLWYVYPNRIVEVIK